MTTPDLRPLLKKALLRIEVLEELAAKREAEKTEAIAVIGLACRFPGGGANPQAFWQALENGVDAVDRIPAERWADSAMPGRDLEIQWAALLEDLRGFDAAFFGISPREALHLDPQQRLVLELVWEALESAGQDVNRLSGSKTGVFLGQSTMDYAFLLAENQTLGMYSSTGTTLSTSAGRVSFTFGFQGPCLVLDTACSSSLVTTHLACQSLRQKECDLALAGGVNLILHPFNTSIGILMKALSPDGRCKTFDARANGFVRGEGGGMVALKRLSDAERDGDPIFAVIRGSAINNDGRSTGLTVPNMLAQKALLNAALENARVRPEEIGYVETHGTGTSLGDPIEFEALRQVLGQPRADGSKCVLGAVKTNIGHLEAAAGVAGLIKVIGVLKKGQIPKNLHFENLNPHISMAGTPFVIPNEAVPWIAKDKPRRAGVSSFGFSGTNAHVIIEDVPAKTAVSPAHEAKMVLLTLSAKSQEACRALATAYAQHLSVENGDSLADIAFTANVRRTHHEHRLAVVGLSKNDLAASLSAWSTGHQPAEAVSGHLRGTPKVVFVFSGQGSQWIGMGRQLYRQEPSFRDALVACDEAIRKQAGFSIIDELDKPEDASRLHETIVAQPALFAVEVALSALLQSWGVVPSAVIGHSVGEISAAYVAGILELEQAARLVCVRARVMQKATGHGKMVSVSMDEQAARNAIAGFESRIGIAAVNDFDSVVLSGDNDAMDSLVEKLAREGVQPRPLRVNYAFHSPQMDALRDEFVAALSVSTPSAGTIPMISTVTGMAISGEKLDTAYWGRNIRQTVRLADAVISASHEAPCTFVEIGPHAVLTSSIAQTVAAKNLDCSVIPTMRREKDERKQALLALAALYVQGHSIQWGAMFPGGGRVVALPTYPWQREAYWLESRVRVKPTVAGLVYDAFNSFLASDDERWEMYLTFGPFRDVISGFSWLDAALGKDFPAEYWQKSLEAQREMRRVLFRHVDFAACKRVLDFGCGYATDLMVLAKRHPHLQLDGYTISTEQAALDLQRVARAGLDRRINIFHRDSANDEFPARYDLVFGFEVAHHIRNKGALFGNVGRHLVEGGHLVLADFISNVAFEIEHEETSSFFLTKQQWVDALSPHGLEIIDCIDISQEIANFLHDPDFDEKLDQASPNALNRYSRSALVSYDRLGKTLRRGYTSYILLSVRKNSTLSSDELAARNHLALEQLIPYEVANPGPARHPLEKWLFEVQWRRKELASAKSFTETQGSWMVIADREATGAALVARLRQLDHGCFQILSEGPYRQISPNVVALDSSRVDDWLRFFEENVRDEQRIAGIVDLSNLDTTTAPAFTGDLAHRCVSTTALVQALVRHGFRQSPRLFLVTRGVQSVRPDDAISVAGAPILGLGKTIALEHPELRCTRIDLAPGTGEFDVGALLEELKSPTPEDQIALRDGARYVARLARSRLDKNDRNDASRTREPAPLTLVRPDATYLVTGGLGGLGLSVASWLVERGAQHVVLVGRRPPSAEAREVIERMIQSGAEVRVVSADISQEHEVQRILAIIRNEMPALAGIIHAAAVLDDHTLLEQTAASFQTVFAPKALGAWHLHAHTQSEKLDFFVMYSSAASLLGSPGQANYCAANAFLDALARERVRLGLPAMSIQWGAFADVGLAAARDSRTARIVNRGMTALTPADGLEILHQLLEHPRPEIGVLRLDIRQWIEFYPAATRLPFLNEITTLELPMEKESTLARETLEKLQAAPPEERCWLVEQHLADQIGLVLQLEPSRIDRLVPLQSLGLDSLTSLELRNRLEALLGVKLPATITFTYPTTEALARHLLDQLGLEFAFSPASAAITTETSHINELTQLSDDELLRAGNEILA